MRITKILLSIFAALPVISCTGEQDVPDDNGNEILNVTVVRPEGNVWNRELLLTGTVRARNKIAISSSISGLQIIDVTAEVGDSVSKGQTLAVLENVNVQTQLEQNEAMLAKALAGLSAMEANVTEEKSKLNRSTRLLKHKAVSVEEYEERVVKYKNAEANVKAAKAEIKQIQAQIRDSLNQREKAEIRSPASGMVITRFAESGSLTDGNVLFYLAADGNLEVEADVSGDELRLLNPGMKVYLCMNQDYADCAEGEIRITDQEVSRVSRTAKIYITPVQRIQLKIGTSFPVRVCLGDYHPRLSLPLSSVNFESNGVPVVKTVNGDGTVSIRHIKLGNKYGDRVEILSGLNENETVILKAGALVNEGDRVQPVYVRSDSL